MHAKREGGCQRWARPSAGSIPSALLRGVSGKCPPGLHPRPELVACGVLARPGRAAIAVAGRTCEPCAVLMHPAGGGGAALPQRAHPGRARALLPDVAHAQASSLGFGARGGTPQGSPSGGPGVSGAGSPCGPRMHDGCGCGRLQMPAPRGVLCRRCTEGSDAMCAIYTKGVHTRGLSEGTAVCSTWHEVHCGCYPPACGHVCVR